MLRTHASVFPDNPDDPSADSIRNTRASLNRMLQSRAPDVMMVQRHDVRRPDGSGFEVRYWSPVNSPLLNADGSLAYIIHRVENVTEFVLLKQQGDEQAQLTDVLRERTMKMEADLYARSREVAESHSRIKEANAELGRLYAKTRELDALKNAFFANVSHELRTPLTLILGPVRKVRNATNLTEEQRHDLVVVERNAGTLLKNVNDLLDLSKLDAGRMELRYAKTDAMRLAAFVASHFESFGGEKKIDFAVEMPGDPLVVEVDSEKLQRVLFNLLSNAFKFTPAQGAVRFRVESAPATVLFVIDDTGPGIPVDLREVVFERFRQVDSGATREHGGTGLGLAIVKEFVSLHRGSVHVEDSPGGGARVVVKIPRTAPEGTPVAAEENGMDDDLASSAVAGFHSPEKPSDGAQHGANSETPLVLVVEDNAEMNAFIAANLAERHRVITAADGQSGLEQALLLRPDLIISDIMMPRLSGEGLVREIRRHPHMDDVPILALTARADEALRVQLLSEGAQDCLIKPFLADELVARATSLIDRKRKAEAGLRKSEIRYHTLFNAIDEGFCIIEVIFDEHDKPIDYRFLETNPAFEKQTGLANVQGRRMRELRANHEAHWFAIYAPASYGPRCCQLNRWLRDRTHQF